MTRLLFIIVLIFALISCQTSTQYKNKPPELIFEKDTVNIGEIPLGDSTTFRIDVKNAGMDTLEIKNIAFGCGCTVGKIKDKHLGYNQKTVLEVKYVNHGDINNIYKTVILENNSKEPFKILRLLGTSVKSK